jgi:putative ABC transport system permease protein
MQIPLRRGRLFTDRDTAGTPKAAIVNESFAHRFWPGQNPIGKHIGAGPSTHEIVGVVADVRAEESTKAAPLELYFPFGEAPTARIALAIRGVSPAALEPSIRRAIYAADSTQPPLEFSEMRQIISGRVASNRLSAQVIALFAGLALVLAAVGIYGVLSFSVGRRTHEIGLRMALGAGRAQVLTQVVGEAAALAAAGIAIGLGGALTLTSLLNTMLYGVKAVDPGIFISSAAALFGVSLLASGVPAIRAARLDPISALRHD